jgi:hypothetical protein
MTIFAVELSLVLRAVCRVKEFVAKSALEAGFVPLLSTGKSLLSGVHGFAALRAFWVLWGLERHSESRSDYLVGRESKNLRFSMNARKAHQLRSDTLK